MATGSCVWVGFEFGWIKALVRWRLLSVPQHSDALCQSVPPPGSVIKTTTANPPSCKPVEETQHCLQKADYSSMSRTITRAMPGHL